MPLDSAHGLIGEVRAGDKVDVLAGFNSASSTTGRGRPQLRTLDPERPRPEGAGRAAPSRPSSNSTQDMTVRVTADQAAQLAFAADNGKVWFILRPPAGASDDRPSSVTLDSLLAGTPTIEVGR